MKIGDKVVVRSPETGATSIGTIVFGPVQNVDREVWKVEFETSDLLWCNARFLTPIVSEGGSAQ